MAFIGAVKALEEENVEWERLAGTSAGAIVAALLASGYSSNEIKDELDTLDFSKLKGKTILNRIPLFGLLLELLVHNGMYKNDYLEKWLDSLLLKKGIETFADLPEGKLKIIASDITDGLMLVLPDDLERYGMTHGDLKVSTAVMMSTTIPFFFRPYILKTKKGEKAYIVDGGLSSNFPVWIFDEESPQLPTFGFHLMKDKVKLDSVRPTPIHVFINVFTTLLQAHDLRRLDEMERDRTISIQTGDIKATDLELSKEELEFLYHSGYESAKKFLASWNFEEYQAKRMQSLEKKQQ